MNLSDITTPADLVKANTNPADIAIDALSEVGFDDTLNIARWLVKNLRDFHVKIAEDKIAEGADNIAVWVADAEKLTYALKLLVDVENDD